MGLEIAGMLYVCNILLFPLVLTKVVAVFLHSAEKRTTL